MGITNLIINTIYVIVRKQTSIRRPKTGQTKELNPGLRSIQQRIKHIRLGNRRGEAHPPINVLHLEPIPNKMHRPTTARHRLLHGNKTALIISLRPNNPSELQLPKQDHLSLNSEVTCSGEVG